MATFRERVTEWNGVDPPTAEQVSAARAWMRVTDATTTDQGRMLAPHWEACTRLLARDRQVKKRDPLVTSAPLPPGHPVALPRPNALLAEIDRAATELMWALHKQRTTWAKMAELKAEAEARGADWYMDNDRTWKLATGEVTWWRGEVNSRANALQALLALAASMRDNVNSHDATTFGDLARGHRVWMNDTVTPGM